MSTEKEMIDNARKLLKQYDEDVANKKIPDSQLGEFAQAIKLSMEGIRSALSEIDEESDDSRRR